MLMLTGPEGKVAIPKDKITGILEFGTKACIYVIGDADPFYIYEDFDTVIKKYKGE